MALIRRFHHAGTGQILSRAGDIDEEQYCCRNGGLFSQHRRATSWQRAVRQSWQMKGNLHVADARYSPNAMTVALPLVELSSGNAARWLLQTAEG